MKKQLVLKRMINVDGIPKAELKIITIDIPQIKPEDGWSVHALVDSIDLDEIQVVNKSTSKKTTTKKTKTTEQSAPPTEPLKYGSKFESDVTGTAKLVRLKDKIFIAYRRGKTTYNQTTPDSICISESMKQEFFKSVDKFYGNQAHDYAFPRTDKIPYEAWDKWMQQEYEAQLKRYNAKHVKG